MNHTLDIDAIAEAVINTLRSEVTFVTADEHAFLKAWIKREEIRAERWEKIKVHVLGWGVVAAVGWLGSIILDAIIRTLHRGG